MATARTAYIMDSERMDTQEGVTAILSALAAANRRFAVKSIELKRAGPAATTTSYAFSIHETSEDDLTDETRALGTGPSLYVQGYLKLETALAVKAWALSIDRWHREGWHVEHELSFDDSVLELPSAEYASTAALIHARPGLVSELLDSDPSAAVR